MVDTAEWFGESAAHLRSFAYIPLKNTRAFGLIALASEDAQRFYPEMGTLYLKRLGELTASALLRYPADPLSNLRAATLLRSRLVRLSDDAVAALGASAAAAILAGPAPAAANALGDEDRAGVQFQFHLYFA